MREEEKRREEKRREEKRREEKRREEERRGEKRREEKRREEKRTGEKRKGRARSAMRKRTRALRQVIVYYVGGVFVCSASGGFPTFFEFPCGCGAPKADHLLSGDRLR